LIGIGLSAAGSIKRAPLPVAERRAKSDLHKGQWLAR
jgi:hypothetical protein